MHIKKFRAANMTEALGLVKKEFGPEAVILSAVNIKNNRTLFGKSKSGVEVTAAREEQAAAGGDDFALKVKPGGYSSQQRSVSMHPTAKGSKQNVRPFYRKYHPAPNRAVAGYSKVRRSHPHMRGLYSLYMQLTEQGVADDIALALTAGVERMPTGEDPIRQDTLKQYLVEVLESFGISPRSIVFNRNRGKRIALVGPTGVGKTTTAAKIAAVAAYRKNRKKVALISIDNFRVGGAAQLKKYAEIIGIPFRFVTNKKGLTQALEQFEAYDLVLIDTPGISHNNPEQMAELKGFLSKIRYLETHLLLSATTKDGDLTDAMEKFSAIPVNRLIFTKMDETSTYGNILNRLMETKVPISYFTKGQNIPEDIEIASLDSIVNRMIQDAHKTRILSSPPEVLAMEIEKFANRLAEVKHDAEPAAPLENEADVSADIFSGTGAGRYANVI